ILTHCQRQRLERSAAIRLRYLPLDPPNYPRARMVILSNRARPLGRRRPGGARYMPSSAARLRVVILPEVKLASRRQGLPLHLRQGRSRRWPTSGHPAPDRGVVDRQRVREDMPTGLPTALVRALGVGVVAEFVRFTLDNGSQVLF